MFGAAGAPATRFGDTLGVMSAQPVLSMIAPALPATPQGTPGANAAAFEGLLAAMLAAGDMTADAPGLRSDAEPASGPLPDGDEAAVAASGLPGFLFASPPAEPSAGSTSAGTSEPSISDARVEPPQPAASSPPVAGDLATSPRPEGPSPEGKSATKAPGPLVLPDGGDLSVPATTSVVSDDDEAAPPVAFGEAATTSAEPSKPATAGAPPVPAPPVPAAPPRPLAERTAGPLDDAAVASVAAEPTDPKGVGSMAVEPAPQTAAQSAKPPAATAGPIPALDAAAPAPDRPAPGGETAAPIADTAAPVREHALSTLSRTTIDATAQIAAQILRKLDSRSTRFEIALRPDDLGRVDVKLDIDSEGRLAARLAFDNPVAATELRGRVDDLRRQLENAGFQLADDAFEFAERDSGSSAFDRGQDSSRGQNRAFAAAARLNNEIDAGQPPRWTTLTLAPAGVDMKV